MPVSLDEYKADVPSIAALGTFDGVHLGHQSLLQHTTSQAQSNGWISLVFVFSQPPGNYLGYPKPMLFPPVLKYQLLERFVDQVVYAEFPQLAWMEPEAFVQDVLCNRLCVKGLVVGENYRFGKDRAGDVALLKDLGRCYGFEVHEVPGVEVDGDWVSSTRIRRAIRAGDIQTARRLLDRPPLLYGQVIQGEGRGQTLGFPTANLEQPSNYITPEQGIFAGVACLERATHPAAVYIGTKPTFEGEQRVIEVHLLEGVFPPLYDQTLHVHLIEKIRDDKSFANADALKIQIQADIDQARQILKDIPLKSFCGGSNVFELT